MPAPKKQTKARISMEADLTDSLRQRIPFAEWATDPSLFTKELFVAETAEYLYAIRGVGTQQDRHALMMLADQLAIYIEARSKQAALPLVVTTNAGRTARPSPFLAIADKAMDNAIKLMNELCLTPRARQQPVKETSLDIELFGLDY